jgi:N-methylhydantoinase A
VPLPEGPLDDALLRRLEQDFHAEHQRRFTYAMLEQPVECLHWRLGATGRREAPRGRLARQGAGAAKPVSRRMAYMAATDGQVMTEIYDGEKLAAGEHLEGPAVVEFATTTVVVSPGDRLVVQEDGSSLLTIAV